LSFLSASIDAAGREAAPVYSFFKDASYLLRERSVFGSGATPQRLFKVIWYVGTDKNSFAIRHLLVGLS
jgi:hypothetical protein